MIPDKILNVFNRSIKMVCSNIACYCNDPVSDFTRKRKLPAETLIHFIVQMQSKSLNSELCEYFTDLDSLPTASALCQQRDKLDISAFQRIMHWILCLLLRLFASKETSLISVLSKELCIGFFAYCFGSLPAKRQA